jgi:hypothetical protein
VRQPQPLLQNFMNPRDFRMGPAISRIVTATTPDLAILLTKADSYGTNAIQGIATLAKPVGISDANFHAIKKDAWSEKTCADSLQSAGAARESDAG